MCDYFDGFDGEFMDDGFGEDNYGEDHEELDDNLEGSADPDFNDELNQEDEQSDNFGWDETYWIGSAIWYGYEEGRRKRRKRKDADSEDPSDID